MALTAKTTLFILTDKEDQLVFATVDIEELKQFKLNTRRNIMREYNNDLSGVDTIEEGFSTLINGIKRTRDRRSLSYDDIKPLEGLLSPLGIHALGIDDENNDINFMCVNDGDEKTFGINELEGIGYRAIYKKTRSIISLKDSYKFENFYNIKALTMTERLEAI